MSHLLAVIRFATKMGLHNILGRPEPYQAEISNGYRILLPAQPISYVMEEALNFKVRTDDVIVSTYSKAGKASACLGLRAHRLHEAIQEQLGCKK